MKPTILTRIAPILAYPIGFLLILVTLSIQSTHQIAFPSHLGLSLALTVCAYLVCYLFQGQVVQRFSYVLLAIASYFTLIETSPLLANIALLPVYLLLFVSFVPKERYLLFGNLAILCFGVSVALHIPVLTLYIVPVMLNYSYQQHVQQVQKQRQQLQLQPPVQQAGQQQLEHASQLWSNKVFTRILMASVPAIFIECFQIFEALSPMRLLTNIQMYAYTFNYTSSYLILVVCLVMYLNMNTRLFRPDFTSQYSFGVTLISSIVGIALLWNQLTVWNLAGSVVAYGALLALGLLVRKQSLYQTEALTDFHRTSRQWLPKQVIYYGLKNDLVGFQKQINQELHASLAYDSLVFESLIEDSRATDGSTSGNFTLVVKEGEQVLSFISATAFPKDVSAYQVIGKEILRVVADFPKYAEELQQYNMKEHSSSFLEQMNFRKELSYYLHDDVLQDLLAASNMVSNLQTEQVATRDLIHATLTNLNDSIRDQMHELFPSSLSDLSFEQNIAVLVEQMKRRFPGAPAIRIQQTIDHKLPEDVAYFFYLSIQELLNNACKHAHASMVIIYLKPTPKTYHLEVQDDGDALPEHFLEAKTSKHLGWTRIQQHIEEFHGTFAIEVLPKGKKFVIQLPRRREL
ncbi:hypothetical protein BAU15_04985 [Enterococcus sp. JM4C]|uniref:sensor histidine kinase n=1 Tax=Candidatus Enterococcus huntleyi TaxID=1857217 RepID=UPI00137B3A87|nr:ATP-binding protein [Enterococcus sp. JM4C]KAF1295112.1 hypothetical protein BAU15_04985 [Enterococcus sp. JM4C]